jgi:ribosome-associated protein
VVIIKAQKHRSQKKNREEALLRLRQLINSVATTGKKRTPTAPTPGSRKKRLESKNRRGRLKSLRGKITETHQTDE